MRGGSFIGAALAVLLTATGAPAQTLNPTGRDITLQVPVREGGRVLGQASLFLSADDRIAVNGPGFLGLIEPVIGAETAAALLERVDGEGRLSPADFEAVGLTLDYDPTSVSLRIDAPAATRGDRDIAVRPIGGVAPGLVVKAADYSGFVNLSATTDYNWTGDGSLNGPTADIAGAFRLGAESFKPAGTPVLETELTVDFEEEEDNPVRWRGSRAVLDFPEDPLRVVLGDVGLPTAGFQDQIDVMGVGLTRAYGALRPDQSIRPSGSRSFTIEERSRVDVIVNGLVVRQLTLEPGTFNLSDIPLTNGANDVALVIESEGGEIETIRFSQFFRNDLLAPGVVEFAAQAGLYEDFGESGLEIEKERPVASGWARVGLTPEDTVGVNLQGDRRHALAGAEWQTVTRLGDVSVQGAASWIDPDVMGMDDAIGARARVTFNRPVEVTRSRNGNLGAFADYRSKDFATLEDDIPNETVSLDLGLRYNQELTDHISGSFGVTHQVGMRDGRDNTILTLGLGGGFDTGARAVRLGARWSLSAQYQTDPDNDEDEFAAFVRLSIPITPTLRSSLAGSTRDDDVSARLDYAEGAGVGARRAYLEIGRDDDTLFGADFGVAYTGNRFEADLRHDARQDDISGVEATHSTRLRVATAAAFADGAVALGRPVRDSFAIVATHPTLEDRVLRVQPQDTSYVAATGPLGNALSSGIGSYRPHTVRYDVDDLPAGYDLGRGVFDLLPTYRSGYHLTVGSAAQLTLVGTLVDPAGEPVSLVTGSARHLEDPDFGMLQVFTNRAGRVAVLGAKPGRYELRLDTTPATYAYVEAGEDALGLVRLGTVEVQLERSGEQP